MSKVKVRCQYFTDKEMDFEYPVYLNFQDDYCMEELVKIDENFKISVKHNFFGFSIEYSKNNTMPEHWIRAITSKEHFEQFFEEAIKKLTDEKN